MLRGRKVVVLSGLTGLIILFLLILSIKSTQEVKKLELDLQERKSVIATLGAGLEDKGKQIEELEAKVEEAKPWFEMSEKEKERKIAEEEKKKKAEEAKAKKKAKEKEEAKKAAEAEERRKQEEEEKKGYDTGITYDQLARTPDDFEGEKVKFKGKVIQVMEGDDSTQLRVAVNDDYDNVIYVEYEDGIVDSRVLEDDQITIMGISAGLLSYSSTMGGKITIPAILVDKIEQ